MYFINVFAAPSYVALSRSLQPLSQHRTVELKLRTCQEPHAGAVARQDTCFEECALLRSHPAAGCFNHISSELVASERRLYVQINDAAEAGLCIFEP